MYVVALTGMMGSGKSTLVSHLAGMFDGCICLHEDDFNSAPESSLKDIQAWQDRGANVSEFNLSPLTDRLHEVREGGFGGVLLLETQFGRLHSELKPWIRFQCWIDVPSDVAVMRKVSQLADSAVAASATRDPVESLRWISGFCTSYVAQTRELFARQRAQLVDLSDVVISAEGTPFDVCLQVWQRLPPEVRQPGDGL